MSEFNVPKGDNITSSVVVRFAKLNGQADKFPSDESVVNFVNGGTQWQFNLPTLDPQQVYVAQFIIRWKKNGLIKNGSYGLSSRKSTTITNSAGTYQYSPQTLNDAKLSAAGNELIIFEIPFRTSQYKTYTQKLEALKLRQMQVDAYIGASGPANKVKLWVLNEQTQSVNNIAKRVQAVLGVQNTNNVTLYPRTYDFWINETFDQLEVNGISVGSKSDGITNIEPIISFSNDNFTNWQTKLFNDVRSALIKGEFKLDVDGYNKPNQQGGYVTGSEDIGTISAPALDDNEIKGLPWIGDPEMRGFDNPNDPSSYLYMDYQNDNPERPLISIKYLYASKAPSFSANAAINNSKLWAVNPQSNGFNAMGNAFDAGVAAFNAPIGGLNLSASIKGKAVITSIKAH